MKYYPKRDSYESEEEWEEACDYAELCAEDDAVEEHYEKLYND